METRDRILHAYTEHLRDHGTPPVSVRAFCRSLDLGERDFFKEFPSLDAVEGAIWARVVDRVAGAVAAGAEWEGFTARQRYLTFLFAFAEESLDLRSLLLARFGPLGPLARPGYLRGFEARFKTFATDLISHGLSSGEIAGRGTLESLYPEVLYVHFRGVIAFNLKDESPGFERTDAFIEKTVAVAFDLIRAQAFDSALDLARFLAPASWGKMV